MPPARHTNAARAQRASAAGSGRAAAGSGRAAAGSGRAGSSSGRSAAEYGRAATARAQRAETGPQDGQQRSDRRARPREVTGRLPMSKVRWNRKVRLVMILVFLLVGWMAVDAASAVLSAHSQANAELQTVQKYAQENHRLERRAHQLTERSYILRAARELGMVKRGEQGYVINGLKPEGN